MSTKTKRWAMAILTVVLVLFMGSVLALPADEDSSAGTTTTGTPVPAVISSQPGTTTNTFDRLIHEDEHDHEDDD
ncbi:MAG TPA: hypothetical protein VFS96_05920 [Nitrolancea sp.]|nr:hypothetical protein [Nitrolancea sp.]